MSRQLSELENILQMLIDEHKRMLAHVATQHVAMKGLKFDAMQDAMHLQEGSRNRIAALDKRRSLMAMQIAKLSKMTGQLTLTQIAALFPQDGKRLLSQRDELKGLIQQVADRTHVAGRLAAAVLGHLNTAMRLFAGAVGQAGVYTRTGVPRVVGRIGVLEAVG